MADDLGQIELCDPEAEHLLYEVWDAGGATSQEDLDLSALVPCADDPPVSELLECSSEARGDGWTPGENCGSWMRRASPLQEQSQVLITNLFLSCRRLAKTCCATILATLPPVGRQVGGKSNRVEET